MQNPNLQEFLFSNVSDIKYAAENKLHSHPLPNNYTFQNILQFFWTSPSRDSFFFTKDGRFWWLCGSALTNNQINITILQNLSFGVIFPCMALDLKNIGSRDSVNSCHCPIRYLIYLNGKNFYFYVCCSAIVKFVNWLNLNSAGRI